MFASTTSPGRTAFIRIHSISDDPIKMINSLNAQKLSDQTYL